MELEFHQIDAFSSAPFGGNPAMVYPLAMPLPVDLMQAIAAEHQLSETTFVWPESGDWRIRWFTPRCEVALCGHATLAAAHVLLRLHPDLDLLRLHSASGVLRVRAKAEGLELDFPEWPLPTHQLSALEVACVGQPIEAAFGGQDLLVVLETEAQVRACAPDLSTLRGLPWQGLIVTAPGQDCDFVSRYFAPAAGIDEDPVTGSIHCALTPYWAARLGRRTLQARQLSKRGGTLNCTLGDGRVYICGQAYAVARGILQLPDMN